MILDGAAVARRLQGEIQERVAAFTARTGVVPALATVLVGDDPASQVYVGNKRRTCERLGLRSMHHPLPADTGAEALLALIDALNADPSVHGILVQLPLPRGLDADAVIARIDPRKDVDGFHPENVGRLALKRPRFTPCTPTGVMRLLDETGLPVAGKRATVVGRSNIVGLPAALMLLHAHATVRIVHSRTAPADLEAAVREAEILVVGVGVPGFVDGAWVRPGAVVVDVGVNRLPATETHPKGRLVGDVGFDAAAERAAWITPVPGGVGPMTITLLMENTLRAAEAAVGAVW